MTLARCGQEFYLSTCMGMILGFCVISGCNNVLIFNKRNVACFSNLLDVFYCTKFYCWARNVLFLLESYSKTVFFSHYCSVAISVGQIHILTVCLSTFYFKS